MAYHVRLSEKNTSINYFSTCHIISLYQQFFKTLLALTVVAASFVVGINSVVVAVVFAFLAEGLILVFLIFLFSPIFKIYHDF